MMPADGVSGRAAAPAQLDDPDRRRRRQQRHPAHVPISASRVAGAGPKGLQHGEGGGHGLQTVGSTTFNVYFVPLSRGFRAIFGSSFGSAGITVIPQMTAGLGA